MKTPARAGTLASTALILLAIFTILRHSAYLEGRWAYVDGLKDGIAAGLKGHLGNSETKSVDPKYIGFGTPTPLQTPRPFPVSTAEATPEPETDQSPGIPVPEDSNDGQPPAEDANEAVDPHAQMGGSEEENGDVGPDEEEPPKSGFLQELPDKIVVMGKLAEEDTTWVTENLPE